MKRPHWQALNLLCSMPACATGGSVRVDSLAMGKMAVGGTPRFFIHIRVAESRALEAFKAMINEESRRKQTG